MCPTHHGRQLEGMHSATNSQTSAFIRYLVVCGVLRMSSCHQVRQKLCLSFALPLVLSHTYCECPHIVLLSAPITPQNTRKHTFVWESERSLAKKWESLSFLVKEPYNQWLFQWLFGGKWPATWQALSCTRTLKHTCMRESEHIFMRESKRLWQIPLNTLHPRNPPNREIQIPRCRLFKLNQIFDLKLYRNIQRNRGFDVGGVPFLVEIVICVFFDVRCLLQTYDRSLT